ncbi:phenylpyruvate tautomerase MIF-related protein [Pannus brasiliensis CCIBt3594]|uniref:L-dopachrome isomerase n=1 Tax=Pannus brasiliensis CCIBt3594 TaxID=1427578 RepID=A0AAW9QGV1_9CHRO
MPLIKIQTSVPSPADETVDELLKTLSSKLAKHLGKPESYVMTALESDARMTFGGTFDPVCYIEVKNIGRMTPEQTQIMSNDFCQEIQSRLGVPKNRVYIEFADAERHLWGWNGGTFA